MDDALFLQMLAKHQDEFHPVMVTNAPMQPVDLSKNNPHFTAEIYGHLSAFQTFINELRQQHNGALLLGGYREVRAMYSISGLFSDKNQSRDLHLGLDIWADAGTPVYAPLGGMVHSLAYNATRGDYGGTIILQHQLETINFYTLYGHLSLHDSQNLRRGQFISRGEKFAHLGDPSENGYWPSHLHLQLIRDMGNWEGDYPGVCALQDASKFLSNSPDPSCLINYLKN